MHIEQWQIRLYVWVAQFSLMLVAGGCANTTGPVPNLTGDWLGGSPNQLALSITQQGSRITANGRLASAGTLASYNLQTSGVGTINEDSTLHISLSGEAGHHQLDARFVGGDQISGTLGGDRTGDLLQVIVLRRHSISP
jgi:hypothetical protein